MTFPTVNPALARALAARGYDAPTAVQLAVLEGGASDRDLLVSAQTGSGKTVAFGLAIGGTLLGDAERFERAERPLALIVAPTRELAMQVSRELTWLYSDTGARVATCVGGMDARAEARALSFGAHIVVGTPGRLRDHLERGRLDLSGLRAVVLDEADEMLDLGFREDLEFILDKMPAERRTLLFSATVPRDIETLARLYQRDALRIETVRRDEQHADIEYIGHRVAPHDIENAVVNVLRFHEARSAIVFCATRAAVTRFNSRLLNRGFASVALSGELTQNERTHALQALRDGRARVLVATDVAARGLDLPDLALVVHAELPNDGETLLHRSGRTGRAGRKGTSVLIVPFNRRRKVEALIGAARLKLDWRPAPTPEAIREGDQARFFASDAFTAEAGEEELEQVRALQAARTADEIALALVRLNSAQLPVPEELAIDTGPPKREPRAFSYREREQDAPRADFGGGDDGRRGPRGRREDNREMVWFRINIGRERNADPRWLLPLICRAGAVTKGEIGVIRINERDTRFQILAEAAEQFEHAARTAKKKEGHIARLRDDGTFEEAPAAIDGIQAGTAAGGAAETAAAVANDAKPVAKSAEPVEAKAPDRAQNSPHEARRPHDKPFRKSHRDKLDGRHDGKPKKPHRKGQGSGHGKTGGSWARPDRGRADGDTGSGGKRPDWKGRDWKSKDAGRAHQSRAEAPHLTVQASQSDTGKPAWKRSGWKGQAARAAQEQRPDKPWQARDGAAQGKPDSAARSPSGGHAPAPGGAQGRPMSRYKKKKQGRTGPG